MCEVCREVVDRYNTRYDRDIQGCCPVIADEIAERISGERTAGYIWIYGVRRPHWWVTAPDGTVHDPMGDELSEEPGFHREEVHRDILEFLAVLPRYERWRVSG